MTDVFMIPDTWTGGSVEVLLWFDAKSTTSPSSALRAIWSWTPLEGPVPTALEDFSHQSTVSIGDIKPEQHSALFGVATLPNGARSAFASHLFLESEGFYLTAGVTVGSLCRAYPSVGAYPFEGSPQDLWAQEVYGWLAELGQHVFQFASFTGGVIGWVTTIEFDEVRRREIPDDRYHGYLVTTDSGVDYLGPNVDDPLSEIK